MAKNKPNELYLPARGLNAFISDMPLMEDTPYQARCPSPLFFSTSLLTFDDLDLDYKPKAKSAMLKAYRKRASSLRLRSSSPNPRATFLRSLPNHGRRLSGNHLHSPRGISRISSGPSRMRGKLQRPRQLPGTEGVEGRSRQ